MVTRSFPRFLNKEKNVLRNRKNVYMYVTTSKKNTT